MTTQAEAVLVLEARNRAQAVMRQFQGDMERVNGVAATQRKRFFDLNQMKQTWISSLRSSIVSMVSLSAIMGIAGISTTGLFIALRRLVSQSIEYNRAIQSMQLHQRLLGLSQEDAADSVDKLTRGLSRQAASAIAQNIKGNKEWGETFTDLQNEHLGPMSEFLANKYGKNINAVRDAMVEWELSGTNVGTALEGVAEAGVPLLEFAGDVGIEMNEAKKSASEFSREIGALGRNLAPVGGAIGTAFSFGLDQLDNFAASGIDRINTFIEDTKALFSGDFRALMDFEMPFWLKALQSGWNLISDWWEDSALRGFMDKALERLGELPGMALDKMREMRDFFVEGFGEVRATVVDRFNNLKDAFIERFQSIWDDVRDWVNRIKATIAELPGNIISGAGDFLRSGASALGIPGFAEGGIVTRPTLAMIGERGPEAVVPLNGGNRTINIFVGTERLASVVLDALGNEIEHRASVMP